MSDSTRRSVRIDWGHVARGASAGFTVMFFGGLVHPLVLLYAPVVGTAWVVVVAVTGFAFAGQRTGAASSPALNGAVAAVAGYALVVPLILISGGEFDAARSGLIVVAAAAVGAVAGHVAGHVRSGGAGKRLGAGRK